LGPSIDPLSIFCISSDKVFDEIYTGTPLWRSKRRGLIRNATIIAANAGKEEAIPYLVHLIRSDAEALIRQHALWAVMKLDKQTGTELSEKCAASDPDPAVRQEACDLLAGECE
jgi:epoxyqueuosine reductase